MKVELDEMVEKVKAIALKQTNTTQIANAILDHYSGSDDPAGALKSAFEDLLRAANDLAQGQAEAKAKAEGGDPNDACGRVDPRGIIEVLLDEYVGPCIRDLVQECATDLDEDENL